MSTLQNQPWPGVNAEWSKHLTVTSSSGVDAGANNTWHYLDNLADLEASGLEATVTLLCVHGNPTWSYLWRSLLAGANSANQMSGEHTWRVVAVDQLDMGFSDRTGHFRRLEDRINDLNDFTQTLGLNGPVVTVGHDWGGIISLGWAVAHPDQLQAAILTNTAVNPAGFDLPAALKVALHPAVHGWGTKTTSAFLKVTHGLASPALTPEVETAFMAPYTSANRRDGVANFVADIPSDESKASWPTLERVSSSIRELKVPALFLWGPKDPVFSDRYLRDLIERMPHADVHRFEGASHLVQEDRDVATPSFAWLSEKLGQRGVEQSGASAVAETQSLPQTPADFVSMLAELDRRREDTSLAVVDMASDPEQPNTELTWAELAQNVDDLANGLAELGVKAGQRISLLVPPGITLTTLIYACLRLGAVIVVADAGLGSKGLSRAIKGAGPDYLVGIERALLGAKAFGWPGIKIAANDFTPATDAIKRNLYGVAATLPQLMANGRVTRLAGYATSFPEPVADADAAILFTSGSTGPAKGVLYTHRRLAAMRDTLKASYNLAEGTALVAGFAPFALLGPALGATSVTPDMDVTSPRTLRATALADAADAINATVIFASPAALTNVLATQDSLNDKQLKALAGVELLLSAGAPLGVKLLEQVQTLVPDATLHTPYGMTEALPVTDISLEEIQQAYEGRSQVPNGVCVGYPLVGVELSLAPLNEFGEPLAIQGTEPDVTGEILIKAAHVKERYDRLWITEAASAAVPGWHRSGDVGHLDSNGRLWVEGRLAHVISTPAGVLTPVALEQLVETLDEVNRAAVVGVGPIGTQAVVVIVESKQPNKRPGLADAQLSTAVRAIAGNNGTKVSAVLVIGTMPTDVRHNSKIDRAALARWAQTTLSGGRLSKP